MGRGGAYVGGRRRIGAVGGLLGRGRLPVGGQLALAALVREHGGEAVREGRVEQGRAEQAVTDARARRTEGGGSGGSGGERSGEARRGEVR
jgi:hypothetical protein